MNWKKIILIFIVFLTFLGTGTMLSNIQSREADQLLEAHGMTNNSRYLYINRKTKVSSFLSYLDKNFKKAKIVLHLDNKKQKNQVLVWANHQMIPLSTENGRYFAPDDFRGQISFAVIGPNTEVKQLQTQGNTYLILGKRYYSVIGELKNYHKIEQNKYYLSTGIKQPTSQVPLKSYRIVIDSTSKTIGRIATHYQAQIYMPKFVKIHQIHRFSILKEIVLALLFWFIAVICNALIAVMERRQVKLTHLKGSLLRNWLINRGCRLILIEGILNIGAYFFLHSHAFYRRTDHLIELLLLSYFVVILAYFFTWLYLRRKENIHA